MGHGPPLNLSQYTHHGQQIHRKQKRHSQNFHLQEEQTKKLSFPQEPVRQGNYPLYAKQLCSLQQEGGDLNLKGAWRMKTLVS